MNFVKQHLVNSSNYSRGRPRLYRLWVVHNSMQDWAKEHEMPLKSFAPNLRKLVKRLKNNKNKRNQLGGLEESMASTSLAIAGVLGGIFFLSPNLTGNAIWNMTNSTSNILGAVLLIIGLICGFFWVKNRKK